MKESRSMTEFQRDLINIIESTVKRVIDEIKIPQYYVGSIVTVNGNMCGVRIAGDVITLPRRKGLSVAVNNVVYICCPTGNLSDGFVDLKRP
jgi:hypothetical protein